MKRSTYEGIRDILLSLLVGAAIIYVCAGCRMFDEYGVAVGHGRGDYGRADYEANSVSVWTAWDAGDRRALTVLEKEAHERRVDEALAARDRERKRPKEPEKPVPEPTEQPWELYGGGGLLVLLGILRHMGVFSRYEPPPTT